MHVMQAQACGQKARPSSTAVATAVAQPAPFICRQRDPSGSSPACSAAPRASSQLHRRQRRRGRHLHPLQTAASQRGDAGRSTDLWSEDLTDTSWGAGWETVGNGDEQREVPQIWPEAEEPTNPEAIAQNVLAVALAAVLALAAGNVLWKILVVCWALISAAARYSVVAMVLLVIAVFLS